MTELTPPQSIKNKSNSWLEKFDAAILVAANRIKPVAIIKKFASDKLKADYFEMTQLENLETDARIYFQENPDETSVFEFLDFTRRTIWFDTDSGMYPIDYEMLFEDNFRPVFESAGLYPTHFTQKHEKQENGCTYTLTFQLGEYACEACFSERTAWYNVSALTAVINQCLIWANADVRLIQIDNSDTCTRLGLFNPNIFIPLMIEFDVLCWAIEPGDLMETSFL